MVKRRKITQREFEKVFWDRPKELEHEWLCFAFGNLGHTRGEDYLNGKTIGAFNKFYSEINYKGFDALSDYFNHYPYAFGEAMLRLMVAQEFIEQWNEGRYES